MKKTEDYSGVSLEEMRDLWERIRTERRAMDFVSDHTKDLNTMSNLMLISYGMKATENLIAGMIGEEPDLLGMDVPY